MTPSHPCSTYKESAIEWLPKIPSDWDTGRIRNHVSLVTERAEGRNNPVALEHIEPGTGRRLPSDSTFSAEGIKFRDRDVLFGKLRPYLAKSWLADGEGEAVGDFLVMRVGPHLDPRYFHYITLSPEFLNIVNGSTFGSKMPRANWEFVGNMRYAFPGKSSQRRIVDFLDRETAKIDTLISKEARLIELLAEKRQTIITQAVTKGLDSATPTKPTGIPQLGDIPAHWTRSQLKQAALVITDGAHVSPETEDGEFDFVSTKDLGPNGIDFEGSLKTSPESYRSLVLSGCQPHAGDLLFSKDGTIGRTTVVEEDREFVVASSLIIIRPNNAVISNKYLNFACQSKAVQSQVSSYAKGAGLPRLSIANLRRVWIPLPPVEEQIHIAERLTSITSSIDYLRDRTEATIKLLHERRSALISAAVTGKIDVREGAA